ncbi:MAG: peptide deformylase [Thiotrichales bacterium]|nr:peptide deformylase [Thiotrichales bacterium]
MSRLEILHFPDPRLRRRAEAVPVVDDDVRRLIDDLLETMYDAPGIGLSAPQVNVAKRVITIDVSKDRNAPLCLVNPEIRTASGETETEEGCLSVPGVYELVKRPEKVRVTALDRDGRSREIEAEGLLAVCIQHEIDHLDGRLFVDYLSRLKRQRIRKKAEKAQRYA